MLILYLDTTTGRWYDANGVELESASPKIAFQSREQICIRTVTATSDTMPLSADPVSWPRDTQWAGKLAKITVDNDYIHKLRGTLADSVSAGGSQITATIEGASESIIPPEGVLRIFSTATEYDAVNYSSRTINDTQVVFTASSALPTQYHSGMKIDCPQAPFFETMLDIDNSNPANGEFQFNLVADSLRLRELMLYTSTASLSSQGMELLFYQNGDFGDEPVRAFLCKTFVITGTIGDVDYFGDIPEKDATDRAYQIIAAIVASGFDVQVSENGNDWIDYNSSSTVKAKFWRFRNSTVKGAWSPGVPLPQGEDGKSAYEIAKSEGFDGSESKWLSSLVGPAGKSAYEIAIQAGFDGSVQEWLDSLVGPAGDGVYYDVSGSSVTDRALYDDKPAGFKFAVATPDNDNRVTHLDIYTKNSDDYADWSSALRISFYGGLQPDVIASMPVEFTPPPSDGVYYFAIDVTANPNATVAQVCIDTDEGELVLPYYSDLGVRKILKNSGILFIYFGNSVPKYAKGRVYLTQMIAADSYQGGGSGDITVVGGTMYYGYLPSTADFQRVTAITADMLEADSIITVDASSVGAISLGNVPAGSFTVVLVPAESGLTVTKDDGFGGKVPFELDNGIAGSGSNGATITIGENQYKVYGEFNLVSGATTVHIN